MNPIIVQTSENVTLVGAGQASKDVLSTALKLAPYLVAADGGAEMALNCGKTPKKVIGDFDSINRATLAQIPVDRQHKITEQDSTDFEKCLSRIVSPLILGVGFLGGRLDHQLAVLNTLVRYQASPCVLLGQHDLVFCAPDNLDLALPIGTRVSLFPMGGCRVDAQGLRWPLNDVGMSLSDLTSPSNEMADSRLRINVLGNLLVILPPDTIGSVVATLAGQ